FPIFFFFLSFLPPPIFLLFPTRRSSDLHSSCALHVMFSMFIVFIFIIFIVRYFCISDSNLFFWHCMQSFCGSVSIHFIYAIFVKLIIECINTFSFIIGLYLFTVIF